MIFCKLVLRMAEIVHQFSKVAKFGMISIIAILVQAARAVGAPAAPAAPAVPAAPAAPAAADPSLKDLLVQQRDILEQIIQKLSP